jgi:hypothetical protein
VQMLLYLVNIAVASVGCLLLMPRLGLKGVIVSVMLGHAAQAGVSLVQIFRLRRARISST